MTAVLGSAELAVFARQVRARLGMLPLDPEQGLELFDRGRALEEPLVAAVHLDAAMLRAAARDGTLPPLLRGIMHTPARRARGGGSLTQRLVDVPEAEWDVVVLELVRSQVAAVLGHASSDAVEPDRSMHELGMDSLGAVELRNRLSSATGLRLPATLIFDYPSPAAVATHLRERVEQRQTAAADDTSGSPERPGGLSALLRGAHEHGLQIDSIPLLTEASRFRSAFASAAELDRLPHVVRMASGETAPMLMCLPSFLAGSGPHQFARFASHFAGSRTVSVFTLPGFRSGELVPATWDAAIDALAGSVREVADGKQFVLVGYSIGGSFAHALARRFEDEGRPPAGVVMLDTYVPGADAELRTCFSQVMGLIMDRGHELMSIDDDNLTAMGSYVRLFREWEPEPIETPALLIRATEPLGDAYEAGRLAWWQLPRDVVEVVSHHFGLIEESAEVTARATETWVAEKAEVWA